MAKIVRKKKKKNVKLINFTMIFFMASVLIYLASALFLRTYNNSLSARKQVIEAQIADIQVQNDALRVAIQTLSTWDRVDNIADENGLRMDQDSIITITTASTNGE